MTSTLHEKEVGPDLMVYDSVRDEVHILNPTAKIVYRLCKEGSCAAMIEQALRTAFKLKEDQEISASIAECLEELRSKGLVPRNG
jgi:PqqD family protein of HPr-rel-A system